MPKKYTIQNYIYNLYNTDCIEDLTKKRLRMKLLKSKTGMAGAMIGSLIGIIVVVIVSVILIPVTITSINESAGNYTSTQQSLLNLIPTLLVVGLLLAAVAWAILKFAGKK